MNLPKNSLSDASLGRHIIIDFHDCNQQALDNPELLEQALLVAAKNMWATVISSHFHPFEPQGATGVVVLSESHISIHSWPEHGYAAVDIFACGDVDFDAGIQHIQDALWSKDTRYVTDAKRWIISETKAGYSSLLSGDPVTPDIYEKFRGMVTGKYHRYLSLRPRNHQKRWRYKRLRLRAVWTYRYENLWWYAGGAFLRGWKSSWILHDATDRNLLD